MLAKHRSPMPTGLTPIPASATINIILDVEENGFETLKEEIVSWGRKNGYKVCIYFFDFRKIDKNELLLTSVQTTIIRKDLNWYGMPSLDKIMTLKTEPSDIFISLIDNGDFPIEFVSKCALSRFKIGRRAFPGHCYDLVISDKQDSSSNASAKEIFDKIVDFLGKISQ